MDRAYDRFLKQLQNFCAVLVAGVGILACPAAGQQDLTAKSQLAKKALEERRYQEAVRLYTELARAVPGNAGMQLNLGLALHSAGRYRQAIGQFSAALKLDPALTPARVLMGIGYLKLGEPANAVPPLQEAVKAEPGHRLALLELADALLSLRRFEQAALDFHKLTEIDPALAKAWQGLGLSYLGLSGQVFQALERAEPNSAHVLALVARSRAEQQQLRSAFHLYKQALAKNPSLRGIHTALAEIYRQAGRADWAEVEEERERQLPPADCSNAPQECQFVAGRHDLVIAAEGQQPVAHYWKARSYSELGLAAFRRLSELPASAEIHELLAEALRARGQHKLAAEELRQALQLVPGNRRLEAALAHSLWLSREFETARPLLERLLEADPASAQLNFELGDGYLQQQEPGKALPWLEKAVRLNPSLSAARASLGRAYFRLGRAADAIGHLEAALPIDADASLHLQLSRAYQRAGKPEQARAMLEKFEALSQTQAAQQKLLEEQRQITPP